MSGTTGYHKVETRSGYLRAVLVLAHVLCAIAAPLSGSDTLSQQRDKRQALETTVPNYLMHFGYLPKEDAHSGLLMSDDVLKRALMEMQHFAHLPETGVMDAATADMMHQPRCGMPDKVDSNTRSKRYALQGTKWNTSRPVTWSLRTRTTGNVDRYSVSRILQEALDVWQANSGLRFRRDDRGDPDIVVSFERREHGDSKSFDGPGMVLAHAYFPGGGIGGDAHFDEDETWRVEMDQEGTSLFAVAVHEFGHSLGLLHSDKKEAIMYPWLIQTMHLSRLPDDDRIAIQAIYGANPGTGNVDRKTVEYPINPWRIPTTQHARVTTQRARVTTERARVTAPYYPPSRTRHPLHRFTTHLPWAPRTKYPPLTDRNRPKVAENTPPPRSSDENRTPEKCVKDYDAIFMFRGELYIFQGIYVWRFRNSMIRDGFPTTTISFWDVLPKNLTRVDAAYENPSGQVVFFLGRGYYVVNVGSPRMTLVRAGALSQLGLPNWLDKVDAAMVWPVDRKTYLFAGNRYWQYDERAGRVEPGFPKQIASGWQGVQESVDAVVPWSDGKTYFFKDKGYWKYGEGMEKQELSAPLLMMCTGADTEGGGSTGVQVIAHYVLVYVVLATWQLVLH